MASLQFVMARVFAMQALRTPPASSVSQSPPHAAHAACLLSSQSPAVLGQARHCAALLTALSGLQAWDRPQTPLCLRLRLQSLADQHLLQSVQLRISSQDWTSQTKMSGCRALGLSAALAICSCAQPAGGKAAPGTLCSRTIMRCASQPRPSARCEGQGPTRLFCLRGSVMCRSCGLQLASRGVVWRQRSGSCDLKATCPCCLRSGPWLSWPISALLPGGLHCCLRAAGD